MPYLDSSRCGAGNGLNSTLRSGTPGAQAFAPQRSTSRSCPCDRAGPWPPATRSGVAMNAIRRRRREGGLISRATPRCTSCCGPSDPPATERPPLRRTRPRLSPLSRAHVRDRHDRGARRHPHDSRTPRPPDRAPDAAAPSPASPGARSLPRHPGLRGRPARLLARVCPGCHRPGLSRARPEPSRAPLLANFLDGRLVSIVSEAPERDPGFGGESGDGEPGGLQGRGPRLISRIVNFGLCGSPAARREPS